MILSSMTNNMGTFKPTWNGTNLNTQDRRQEHEWDTYLSLQK